MLLELVYSMMEQEALGDESGREAKRAAAEEDALLAAGAAAALPTHLESIIAGVHGAAVTSLVHDDDDIISGAGNGQIRRVTIDGRVGWEAQAASSGVLALALVPAREAEGQEAMVVAAAMNGSVAVHSGATGAQLATCSPHRKYVIAAAVTAARRIVTGSWDGTLCVTRLPDSGGGSEGELEVLATQSYDTGIAAVAMLSDGKTAVIALKSSCRLRLYDTEKLQEAGRVNMNDAEWDEHLSFSATTLNLSPDGSFLLASTDGPRIMVLRVRDWSKAKLLYGLHTAANFHQYSACWLGTSHVAAAAEGGTVFIFRLSDGKVVEKLAAHPGSNVRALDSSAAGTRLITGSFDKTIRVYTSAPAAEVV